MKLTRQARLVRDHLYAHNHLTGWQAEGVYRIRRLASRIHELTAAGYEVEKETCEDATGQRYTRYSLSPRQKRNKRPVLEAQASQRRYLIGDIRVAFRDFTRDWLADIGLKDELYVDSEVEKFAEFLEGYFQ